MFSLLLFYEDAYLAEQIKAFDLTTVFIYLTFIHI